MGPPSYMWSVVHRNVVMRRMTVVFLCYTSWISNKYYVYANCRSINVELGGIKCKPVRSERLRSVLNPHQPPSLHWQNSHVCLNQYKHTQCVTNNANSVTSASHTLNNIRFQPHQSSKQHWQNKRRNLIPSLKNHRPLLRIYKAIILSYQYRLSFPAPIRTRVWADSFATFYIDRRTRSDKRHQWD